MNLFYIYLSIIPIVVILSWVVSIYNADVVSLLGTDGGGWLVTSIMHNMTQAPIGLLTLWLIAISSVTESGMLSSWMPGGRFFGGASDRPRQTLLQRRAMLASTVIALGSLALLFMFLCIPGNPLYSPFGSFYQSPLYFVLPTGVPIIIAIMGSVYGYMVGRATQASDMAQMHLTHIRRHAILYPVFLCSAQIDEMLAFSQLNVYIPDTLLTLFLYLVPILYEILTNTVYVHNIFKR